MSFSLLLGNGCGEEVLDLVAQSVREEDEAVRLEVQLGAWRKIDGERERVSGDNEQKGERLCKGVTGWGVKWS
jgi:hypothetical protein